MIVRKTLMIEERIRSDDTGKPSPEISRVVALAVVGNPFAGDFGEDLTPLFEVGAQLGEMLMADAVERLSGAPVGYGKAAIVGSAGAMEHGAATIHPRLGKPMRAAVGGGEALIPANVKIGAPGTPIDIPLGHKDNPWAFDFIDTVTIMVPDAPRADEIVVCMAVSDGPRPHSRVGSGPVVR